MYTNRTINKRIFLCQIQCAVPVLNLRTDIDNPFHSMRLHRIQQRLTVLIKSLIIKMLNNLIKHFNGISPYSYIQSLRILRSVDMLKNTSMPVTHIAFECGFNNTVSYNKMFKKVMGCTPTDIRRG